MHIIIYYVLLFINCLLIINLKNQEIKYFAYKFILRLIFCDRINSYVYLLRTMFGLGVARSCLHSVALS